MAKALKEISMPNRSDFVRQDWFVTIDPGVTIDDILDPQFWVHQRLLKKHDLIELVAADGSLDVLMRVAELHGNLPILRILRVFTAETGMKGGDAIEFIPGRGWKASAAGEEIVSGVATRVAAEEALKAFRGGAA